jgi:predicted DNA-binding antitoxin AbrB/MazE fold protein
MREIQQRQYDAPFRKNQKVMVNENMIDVMLENGVRKATLTANSMLVMQNPTSKPLMKLRLYNSKIIYAADVTYAEGVMKPKGTISVKPANIIHVSRLTHHRFNNVVFVLGDHTYKTEQYTVLKNSNNVIIVNRAK